MWNGKKRLHNCSESWPKNKYFSFLFQIFLQIWPTHTQFIKSKVLRILFVTDDAIYFVWFEKGVSVAVLLFECLCSVAQTNGEVIKILLRQSSASTCVDLPVLFFFFEEVFSCDTLKSHSAEGVAWERGVLKYLPHVLMLRKCCHRRVSSTSALCGVRRASVWSLLSLCLLKNQISCFPCWGIGPGEDFWIHHGGDYFWSTLSCIWPEEKEGYAESCRYWNIYDRRESSVKEAASLLISGFHHFSNGFERSCYRLCWISLYFQPPFLLLDSIFSSGPHQRLWNRRLQYLYNGAIDGQ